MNTDTNRPTLYTLEDRLSHWRAQLKAANILGDADYIARCKSELEQINIDTTAANTAALNELEEARRQDRKIRDFINYEDEGDKTRNPDGTWSEG